MTFEFTQTSLAAFIYEISEMSYKRFATENGDQKRFISRAEADRRFGRPKVQSWMDTKQVTPGRDKTGRKSWNFDVMELTAAAISDNRFKHINIK